MNNDDVMVLSEKYESLFKWLSAEKGDPLYGVNTVIITGGRYSQKSFGIGTFAGVATKDFNHRILYTRYTLSSTEDSIIPEFTQKLELLNCEHLFRVTKGRIEAIHNNSKIAFKGIKTSSGNQTANLKSLKDFSIFILDEGEEMPNYEDWDKIKKSMRALDVRNLSIISLNPTTKEHWIYDEFFEDQGIPDGFNGIKGNVLYIHSTYRDIEREFIADDTWVEYEELRETYEHYESLSAAEKEKLDAKIIRKAKYYKHVILGGWLEIAEGVIFTNWYTGEFKDNGKTIFGQDFGFSVDPTTLVEVSIFKPLKKIYLRECFYDVKLTTSDILDKNKRFSGGRLIIADSAEPRLIEELSRSSIKIKEAVKGPGSVTAGIALMQDYELIIDPSSKNLRKELNNYVWNDKKSKTPVDDWNHLIDAARYAITFELGPKEDVFVF